MSDKQSGYILLYRSFWNNPLYEGERFDTRSAWLYLFSHANYKKNAIKTTGGVVSVGRGQLFTTIRYLALIFQWDKDTVSRFLHKLEKAGMITRMKSNHGTLITIVNYNKYQGSSGSDVVSGDTDTDMTTDMVGDMVGDTESPLLNKSNKESINESKKESKKEAPPRRGGWGVEYE